MTRFRLFQKRSLCFFFSLILGGPPLFASSFGLLVSQEEQGVDEGLNPAFSSLLKPRAYQGVLRRQVVSGATLTPVTDVSEAADGTDADAEERGEKTAQQKYHFYAAMLIRAPQKLAKNGLLSHELYPQLSSLVRSSKEISKDPLVVQIEGGIWGWTLKSMVKLEKKSSSRIQYEIIQGHFKGLKGHFFLESKGPEEVMVYLYGTLTAEQWPPRLILLRGAEFGLSLIGRRIRSHIEKEYWHVMTPRKEEKEDGEKGFPQPQRGFQQQPPGR
jgi:hypothetical protein